MNTQIIDDNDGNILETELPQWQKNIIDERLDTISKNPQRLKPIKFLLQEIENEE